MSDKREADKVWKLTPSTPKSASIKEVKMKTNINFRQVSEIKICYKPKVKAENRYRITCSQDAYNLLIKEAFDPNTIEYKEYVKLIALNRDSQVMGITTISEGGINSSVVDIRLILQIALLTHSSAIILAHNHPTGQLLPSIQDDMLTKQVKDAAKIMDITLHDHLIVSSDNYYSYTDDGKL